MLKQGYVAPRLKSSLQKFSGSHHNLVDRYEISIFQWIFSLLRSFLSFLYHRQDFNRPLLYTWITGRVSYKKQELITLHKQRGYLRFIRFPCCVAFLYVLFVFVLCLVCPMLYVMLSILGCHFRFSESLVLFCVVFCRSLFAFLYFFF
jgi:hypothetical protein